MSFVNCEPKTNCTLKQVIRFLPDLIVKPWLTFESCDLLPKYLPDAAFLWSITFFLIFVILPERFKSLKPKTHLWIYKPQTCTGQFRAEIKHINDNIFNDVFNLLLTLSYKQQKVDFPVHLCHFSEVSEAEIML